MLFDALYPMIRPSLQQVRYKKHVSQLPQPSGQPCFRLWIQLEAAATGTLAERNLLVSPLYPATEPPLRARLPFATVHPLAKRLLPSQNDAIVTDAATAIETRGLAKRGLSSDMAAVTPLLTSTAL